jgi:hypothetical protein
MELIVEEAIGLIQAALVGWPETARLCVMLVVLAITGCLILSTWLGRTNCSSYTPVRCYIRETHHQESQESQELVPGFPSPPDQRSGS